MAMKRKFSSWPDSCRDKQRQRQLYASKIERCSYHEIFSSSPVSTPAPNVSICDAKTLTVAAEDLYQPLAPFQIRLLHIEKGEFDEPLRTSLSIVDLLLDGGAVDPVSRNYCTYEAISHSWGNNQAVSILSCNNNTIAIRESQYTMLRHLCSKSERRCVWLDTICIDQNNNAERALQVGKMFVIFKHAQRVLIWLGLPKPRTAQVFKALAQMKVTRLLQKLDLPQFSVFDPDAETPFVPGMCSSCHTEFALGLDEISAFSWFYRTWVRQEVFASESVTLLCGSLEISWPEFVRHILVFIENLTTNPHSSGIDLLAKQLRLLNMRRGKTHLDDEDLQTGSLSFVYELFDQQTTQNSHDGADLFSVLANSASFESSDSRDVVYGVLGMSNAQTLDCGDGRPFLTIEYDCKALEVFRRATEYFIRREKSLDAMFLAQFNRHPLGRGASWCPYWPVMNCEPEKLRSLCHVGLLDRYSNRVSLASDGRNWPRVIDAQEIEERAATRADNFCSFKKNGIQIEGHILGVIRAQRRFGKRPRLIFTVLTKDVLKPGTTTHTSSKGLNEACNEYTPLHIEHAVANLNAFISRISGDAEGKATIQKQKEIDRLCLSSVPATTRDGDLFCFLRASPAFVILRPFELTNDLCRVRFIGIAFASQGIFDESKLIRPGARDPRTSFNHIFTEIEADIEAFKRITQKASDDEIDKIHAQSSANPALSSAPSVSTRNESGNQASTNRPRTATPLVDPVIVKPFGEKHNLQQQVDMRFQQHFNGPIKSLKITFDIL